MSDVAAGQLRALDGAPGIDRLAGHAAHDVDAELKPQRMDVLRQRPKALAALCRGEAVHRRDHPAVFVDADVAIGRVLRILRLRVKPEDIHHHIFPSVAAHMPGDVFCVAAHLLFGHGRSVAVPAVPSHRRGLGNFNQTGFLPLFIPSGCGRFFSIFIIKESFAFFQS